MPNPSETIRVLHVDDDPRLGEMVGTYLEREDDRITVRTATDAESGRAMLAEHDIDCVVSDYDMPGMDGIDFLEDVRETSPDLPFILFTGKGSEEVAADAISAGVTDYLQKESGTSQYTVLANRISNAVAATQSASRAERDRHRLEQLLKTVPGCVVQLDTDGRFVYANRRAEDVLGIELAEVTDRTYNDPAWNIRDLDGDPIPDDQLPFRRVLDTGEPLYGAEHSIEWPDGTRKVLLVNGAPLFDERGDVESVVFSLTDITERRERERKLDQLRTRAQSLMYTETDAETAQLATDIADDIIGAPLSGVHLLNDAGDALELVGKGDAIDSHFHGSPGYPRDAPEGSRAALVWEQFTEDDPLVVDDLQAHDALAEATPARSVILQPVGDHGVFIVSSAEADAFDETDAALAELLATVLRTALDRVERERQFREEREFTEQLIDTIPDLFYVAGVDGTLRRWNARVLEVTGYGAGELEGMDAREFFAEDDRDEVGEAIAETLAAGQASVEARVRTADGDLVPYEFTGGRLTDSDGAASGLVGIGRDITARKQRERALERLHAATRDLMRAETSEAVATVGSETATEVLELSMNGVHLHDPDAAALVPVAWADRTEDPLGGPPPALPVEDSVAGEVYRTGAVERHADVREADRPFNPETPFRSELYLPLGDHGVFILASTTPDAFDAADEALARVLAANVEAALDRVEQRRQLRRERDRFEEFASVVSHDLRNPLNLAQGRLELARAECDSDHLDDVAYGVDRSLSMIDDLLVLARQGVDVGEMEVVDMAALVERCWRTIEPTDATLVVDIETSIRADESRLNQLLENLLRNAVEHGSTSPQQAADAVEHGGEDVTITVGELADGDGFYVADDGPGIPDEEAEAVFETGYSTVDAGTGFGLNIVGKIADAHGWEVTLTESEAGGARFEITGVAAG